MKNIEIVNNSECTELEAAEMVLEIIARGKISENYKGDKIYTRLTEYPKYTIRATESKFTYKFTINQK